MSVERVGRRVEIESLLGRVAELRVLVVGDLILDEYRSGEVDRISPEAPVPVVRVLHTASQLGGAANVARGVVSLGAECRLVGLVGQDAEAETLCSLVEALGVSPEGIVHTSSRQTTHKLRVSARGQQMLRLDREEDSAIGSDHARALQRVVLENIEGCELVILEDYDKGIFGDGFARWVIELARSQGKRVLADPKCELARFRGASLVKPNLNEAMQFVSGSAADFDARRNLLGKLHHELGGGEVVVTRGRLGMCGLDEHGHVFDAPTRPLEVYDVQGAGDTSIVALGLCRAAGMPLEDACIVANAAAAVAVEKVGTAAVGVTELLERLPEILAVHEETR